MANSKINISVNSDIKSQTNEILESLGLDLSTAINIYLRKIIEYNGIPFPVKKGFNAETEQAIEESRKISAGEIKAKSYDNVAMMFSEILAEGDTE